jgi:hypothetical protein
MSISINDRLRGTALQITDDELIVTIEDGRKISVPLAWFPSLLHATAEQRNDWRWVGGGDGIHWPQLDEDLSVTGFMYGQPGKKFLLGATAKG